MKHIKMLTKQTPALAEEENPPACVIKAYFAGKAAEGDRSTYYAIMRDKGCPY